MSRFFLSILNYETPRGVSRKGGLRRDWRRNFRIFLAGKIRTLYGRCRGKEFRNSQLKNCRGFSLAETLVVLAIASFVTIIVASVFSNTASREALNKQTAIVVSLLETARGSTLSGRNASVYGVHFESAKVVLFVGTTYNASNSSNITETLNPHTQISEISLAGGGSEIIFNRLTGETGQFGTVKISLTASSTQLKTITVFQTGLIQSN